MWPLVLRLLRIVEGVGDFKELDMKCSNAPLYRFGIGTISAYAAAGAAACLCGNST